MDALWRQNIGGGRRSCRGTRWRRGRNSGRFISALVGNAPDAAALIVRDIQRPIGPDRQSGWAVCRSTRLLVRSSEAVREHDEWPGRLAICQWLEHDIVAALRFWRAIPGSMEGNKGAVFIGGRELIALIDQHIIGRPMRREGSHRRLFLRADANRLSSVATVFRRQDELFLDIVVIAFRPAEIRALS